MTHPNESAKTEVTLTVTPSEFWLLTQGFVMLTSDDGERRLRSEYPNMDIGALVADCESLFEKLCAANEPRADGGGKG